MDSASDVVMTVAKSSHLCSIEWSMFVPYVTSLSMSGFKGKKVMFVAGLSNEIKKNLTDADFELIEFIPGVATFGKERIVPVLDYLKLRASTLRYVVWTDWSDVVFQSNPSEWLENHLSSDKIIGCTDSVTIENGGGTDEWVKAISPDVYEQIKGEDVCCCGTLAGESQAMLNLLEKMQEMLSADANLIDQGILNYLLRVSPFKEVTRIPKLSEGFVGGLVQFLGGRTAVWTNPHPTLDPTLGLVYPAGSATPFVLLHQHNRNAEWWHYVSRRYTGTQYAPTIVIFPPDDRIKTRACANIVPFSPEDKEASRPRSLRAPKRFRP